MSLRTRLALAFAILAAAVAGLMGVLGYTATSNQLEHEADQSLLAGGMRPPHRGPDDRDGPGGPGEADAVALLSAGGVVLQSDGAVTLPVTGADKRVAASATSAATARTQVVDGVAYRIVTMSPGGSQGAIMRARDYSESLAVLRRLATVLAVCALALAAGAALVGWLVARQITKRLVLLTETAEQVSATGQLDVTVPGAGSDEVGRLSGAFNKMLGRLAASQEQQQRLVQDAGHELRTPLTSLRTNISLLERFEDLSPDVRDRVLADLRGESRELTALVDEVLTLASGEGPVEEAQPVPMARIAEAVAVRARRRNDRQITVTADDSVVMGSAAALERAMWNLVDNAAKFDADHGPIEIHVDQGRVQVLDRGPGVAAEEVGHLFDRFYRPVSSRSLPGSGLGLAIVKDVAQAGGGDVFVQPRPGGGSIFGFRLPVVPESPVQ